MPVWLIPLLFLIGGFLALMFTGMPVPFAFALVNLVGAFVVWGGGIGLEQLVLSIYDSVTKFSMLPIIMFILMGEIMFQSEVAHHMLDTLKITIGRLPGRLALVTVVGAALFSTLSGSTMGTTAMLGDVLVPEMERQGYKKPMTLGPIIGSGGLAMMIPPTGLGVLLATIAEVSIGRFLIAIIVPGVLLALLYSTYVVVRCQLQPHLTPAHEIVHVSLSEKVVLYLKYVLPLGSIIFVVLGFIFLGVATPSQSAALGTIATFFLAAAYKGMNWQRFKNAVGGTTRVGGSILLILTGSTAFSQLLSFTGATRGLVNTVLNLPFPPLLIITSMIVVVLILGCIMDPPSIMMITLPVFMPIVDSLGFDSILFAVTILLAIEMGQTTPPFGMILFVMKGVAPSGTTMGDIYRAGLPFLACDLLLVMLMLSFPPIVLWLPNTMR